LIKESSVVGTLDTKISQAAPTTNYRTSDLTIKGTATNDKIVVQFSLPTGLDPASIMSARTSLNPKTITGIVLNPTLQSALIDGTLDYRDVTWDSPNNGVAWTNPGGDVYPNTQSTTSAIQHTVNERLYVDCTKAIVYAYDTLKTATVNVLIWTTTNNVDITYYSFETSSNGPVLLITYREANTSDRVGLSTSVISVPSI